jgi:hypothetical protein
MIRMPLIGSVFGIGFKRPFSHAKTRSAVAERRLNLAMISPLDHGIS